MHPETIQVLGTIGTARPVTAPMSLAVETLPHDALTYADTGEDMALRRLFKRRILSGEKGTYVDIGCAAPVSISNTYLFYCLGWRGLCVDPNPEAPPHWKASRPEDMFISAAVTETEGQVNLYRHSTNLGMHRIGNSPPSADFDSTPVLVPAKRLDALFDAYLPGRSIQLMSIDVEGAEMGVLRSNDWAKWRPEVIILECDGFQMMAPRESETVAFLLDRNYRLEAKMAINVVLIAQ